MSPAQLVVFVFNHEARNALIYQISTKTDNPRLSYYDFTISSLGTGRHLEYGRKWISTIFGLSASIMCPHNKFEPNWLMRCECQLSMIQQIFAVFNAPPNQTMVLRKEWAELYQSLAGRRSIIDALDVILCFRYVAPFRQRATETGLQSKINANFLTYYPCVKIGEG